MGLGMGLGMGKLPSLMEEQDTLPLTNPLTPRPVSANLSNSSTSGNQREIVQQIEGEGEISRSTEDTANNEGMVVINYTPDEGEEEVSKKKRFTMHYTSDIFHEIEQFIPTIGVVAMKGREKEGRKGRPINRRTINSDTLSAVAAAASAAAAAAVAVFSQV